MKKFLVGLALAAAFVVSLPAVAQAQFHTTSACNATPSGKIAGNGLGPNGAVAMRLQVEANGYAASGGKQIVRDELLDDTVAALNEVAENAKDSIRFSASKFDAPVAERNVTLYFEVYRNTDN